MIFIVLVSITSMTNIIIKYSILKGDKYYNLSLKGNITSEEQLFYTNKAIKNLKRASELYIVKNSKRHVKIAQLYSIKNNKKMAIKHAKIANKINPSNTAPIDLLNFINSK